MDPVASVRAAVERHPVVRAVEVVGSRARGDPTALSDWDFLLETDAGVKVGEGELRVTVERQLEAVVCARLAANTVL